MRVLAVGILLASSAAFAGTGKTPTFVRFPSSATASLRSRPSLAVPRAIDRRTQGINPLVVRRSLVELGLGRGPLNASSGKNGLFNTLFGRDSIRMATDLVDLSPPTA